MKHFFAGVALTLFSLTVLAQTFDVDTILYNGNINTHINIVILGDGYTVSELDLFITDATNNANALFTQVPFSNYKNYFNVFLIKVPSNVSGAAMDPNNLIDNYYGSTFWYAGIERLLVPTKNSRISSVLANNFPAYDHVLMLVNSSKYGGSGGWLATSSTNSSANEIVFHELGHSFSDLADEYWAGPQYANEAINMTQETNIENLRWKNWHGEFGVGLYPHSESPTWYRPHQNCKMRYLGVPFCAVCVEATIETVHQLVSPLLSHNPVSTNIAEPTFPLEFNLNLINPIPNTLKRTWELNGSPLNSNVDLVLLNKTDLLEGSNTLAVTVEDTTQLLRVDNHISIHLEMVNWTIQNTVPGVNSINSQSSNLKIELYPNPFSEYLNVKLLGEAKGSLTVEIADLQGKVAIASPLSPTELNTIPLNGLNSGVFIAKFYLNSKLITSKMVVKTE
jgi:hypothetical protein